jgi:hypothetical protein
MRMRDAGVLPPREARRKRVWMTVGVIAAWFVLTLGTLLGWIGLTYWLNQDPAHPVSADVIFNYLLVSLVTFIGLPMFHFGFMRRSWQREKRRLVGLPFDVDPKNLPPAGPLPKTRKTWQQWVLYIGCYVLGMAALMTVFGPLGNQIWLIRTLGRFSAGSASFGSLVSLVFFVPAGALLLLVGIVLDKERDAIERGELDPVETLRLRLKQEWLFAFVGALATAGFLCFFAGRMTAAYL